MVSNTLALPIIIAIVCQAAAPNGTMSCRIQRTFVRMFAYPSVCPSIHPPIYPEPYNGWLVKRGVMMNKWMDSQRKGQMNGRFNKSKDICTDFFSIPQDILQDISHIGVATQKSILERKTDYKQSKLTDLHRMTISTWSD